MVMCLWPGKTLELASHDIYGRVFFPNGTALGSDFIINQNTTNGQYNPSVSGLINGNVFVAWDDDQAGTTLISMGGSSFLMEQPWGVSLSLIKSQPVISNSLSLGFNKR